jgi:hypothetical protein
MTSYEAIKQAVDEIGVKRVAAELRVSPALVYKWCEPPASDEDPDQSGARNPLDRVRIMYMLTKDIRLVRWLCQEAGGFFVPNPVLELHRSNDQSIFNRTRTLMRGFAQMLDAVHDSMADDSCVDPNEACKIRTEWEELKSSAEEFVVACERGHYHLLK